MNGFEISAIPGYRCLILIIAFALCSFAAFAQFPLKASKHAIKSYFDKNVPYANQMEFKTQEGIDGLYFRKVRVIGDYTFYFNQTGECDTFIETYDKRETNRVISYLDAMLCRLTSDTWASEDNTFKVILLPPEKGANYISLTYQQMME